MSGRPVTSGPPPPTTTTTITTRRFPKIFPNPCTWQKGFTLALSGVACPCRSLTHESRGWSAGLIQTRSCCFVARWKCKTRAWDHHEIRRPSLDWFLSEFRETGPRRIRSEIFLVASELAHHRPKKNKGVGMGDMATRLDPLSCSLCRALCYLSFVPSHSPPNLSFCPRSCIDARR